MKKILLLPLLFLLIVQSVDAQRSIRRRYTRNQNKPYFEVYAGVGVSSFLGELGGANAIGTNFAKDLDIEATRLTTTIGGRVFYHPRIAQRVGLTYGWLSGDDKRTKEPARNERNLNFRTPVFEVMTAFEIYLLKESTPKNRYRLTAQKQKGNPVNIYLWGGVGGFYFNPKGQNPVTGEWVALQPLRTEGQGYDGYGTRQPYKRFQLCIPFGLGFTFRLHPQWRLGIDLGLRKTFTDYIDDVSLTYVDPSIFAQNGSSDPNLAAIMANKSQGNIAGAAAPGQQRGDPKDLDSYMFLTINLAYKIGGGGPSMPKFF